MLSDTKLQRNITLVSSLWLIKGKTKAILTLAYISDITEFYQY